MFASLGVLPESMDKVAKMNLSTWETFLLIRLVRNLKGSQVDFITFVYFTVYPNEIEWYVTFYIFYFLGSLNLDFIR